MYHWEFVKAEEEFLRAMELNPRYLQSLDWYSFLYLASIQGRFDEGISIAKKAVEIDPLSGYAHSILAQTYVFAGRGDEAVRAAKSGVELGQSFFTYWGLQNAQMLKGQYEEAVKAGEMALALSGRHAWPMGILAATYAAWGKVVEAKAIWAELVARATLGYMQPLILAIAASAAGEADKAAEYARNAYEIRDPMLIFAKFLPATVQLREDPRFTEILACMGLR